MEQTKKRILSGIQPTGTFTLGNYVGAVRNWDALQSDYNCIYMIANMHAINLYSLLTSSIYRIQAIIDEQRHAVLRTGLPYDLGCLGRAGDELAS